MRSVNAKQHASTSEFLSFRKKLRYICAKGTRRDISIHACRTLEENAGLLSNRDGGEMKLSRVKARKQATIASRCRHVAQRVYYATAWRSARLDAAFPVHRSPMRFETVCRRAGPIVAVRRGTGSSSRLRINTITAFERESYSYASRLMFRAPFCSSSVHEADKAGSTFSSLFA